MKLTTIDNSISLNFPVIRKIQSAVQSLASSTMLEIQTCRYIYTYEGLNSPYVSNKNVSIEYNAALPKDGIYIQNNNYSLLLISPEDMEIISSEEYDPRAIYDFRGSYAIARTPGTKFALLPQYVFENIFDCELPLLRLPKWWRETTFLLCFYADYFAGFDPETGKPVNDFSLQPEVEYNDRLYYLK